jgi:Subtilisin inhibitor-like
MGRTCKGTVSYIWRVALIGVCLSLISGCGPLNGSGERGSTTTATTASETQLVITVWPRGEGPSRTWTLACDPVGGSLPGARSACSRLSRAALRPLPRDSICTQIYGGPQKARVRGRIDGQAVDERFSRTNGCEIHRWDGVRFLFPVRI